MKLTKIAENEKIHKEEYAFMLQSLIRILNNVAAGILKSEGKRIDNMSVVHYSYTLENGVVFNSTIVDSTSYKAATKSLLRLIEAVQDHMYYNNLVK